MNITPSPLGQDDHDRSSSPRRKKVRQKYAPKACISCRRSKLKCSGDNPCQRCRDNGKRCFFSEDQTAAEALQNLSRPSLPQQSSTSTNNGSGLARRSIIPRLQNNERRASDASTRGLSMEARMARIESMMETLLQERSMYTTSSGAIHYDESGSDIAMPMQIADSLNPALAFLSQPSQTTHSQDAIDPLLGTGTANLRVGNRRLLFPDPAIYQSCIDVFFRDFHYYYPCVDEQRFRSRSQRMSAAPEVHPEDVCFLALNYIMFALHDVLRTATAPDRQREPAGWHWLQLADEVTGKQQLCGNGDISLAQFLLFKALYYTFVDQPSLAYTTIGLASRYALQCGLNLKTSYTGPDVGETFERLQVFWVVLIVDRRISLSCNRPYVLRDLDIDVERPRDVFLRDIVSITQSTNAEDIIELQDYLELMIDWSRFASSLWDSVLAAHLRPGDRIANVPAFDAAIENFIQFTLLGTSRDRSIHPHRRLQYVWMCFDNLKLMAQRASASAQPGQCTGSVLKTAITAISHVRRDVWSKKDAYPLQHQMVTTLNAGLFVLCSTVVNVQSLVDLDTPQEIFLGNGEFAAALDLVSTLARELPVAQRVLSDFDQILPIVRSMLKVWQDAASFGEVPDWTVFDDIIPVNVADLLPYKEQVPDIHFPVLANGLWASNGGYSETDRGSSN